jgi:hypothetical protein
MTSQMPAHLTKVSYILPKRDKPKLERAARSKGLSMSALITETLIAAGIIPSKKSTPK